MWPGMPGPPTPLDCSRLAGQPLLSSSYGPFDFSPRLASMSLVWSFLSLLVFFGSGGGYPAQHAGRLWPVAFLVCLPPLLAAALPVSTVAFCPSFSASTLAVAIRYSTSVRHVGRRSFLVSLVSVVCLFSSPWKPQALNPKP